MGTRHVVTVKSEGETKIAQYGQWDGYLTGQGQVIQEFLEKADLKKFQQKLRHLKTLSDEEVKDYWVICGAEPGESLVSMEVASCFQNEHPGLSRDTGAEILQMVYEGKVTEVYLDEEFEKDTLFCEYAYKLDLDNKTISVIGAGIENMALKEFQKLDLQAEEDKLSENY